MPDVPPPPAGFKVDAPPPPPGFTLDKGGDHPGSVFDQPTVGQRLKRVGRGLGEVGASAGPAIAGIEAGAGIGTMAEGGIPGPLTLVGGVIGGGIGGAASAIMGATAAGQHASHAEILRSAAINAAFGALPGLFPAGKAAAVAPEIEALPKEAQYASIKPAMRVREGLKSLGATDEQIAGAQGLVDVDKIAQAGKDYKTAFQGVIDHTRGQFTQRYNTVLGNIGTFEKVKAEPQLIEVLRDQTKVAMDELRSRMGPTTTASKQFGGLSPELVTNLENAIPDNASIADLRAVRTQIRNLRNAPSATNPMKAALQQMDDQLQTTIDDSLRSAGATPEQIGGIKAIDEDYGRFQDVLDKMDPRSERYGTDVANALFDPMLQNPNDAANFIKMAKTANEADASIMPQLKSAFIDKVIADTKVAAQGRPVEEMRLLQKMQSQWGGAQGTKTVLAEMFGENSMMANPTVAGRVLGKLANADQAAANDSPSILKSAGHLLKSPEFLTRLAVTYGIYRAVAGGTGSPWRDLSKPEVMIPALAAIFLSGKVAHVALGAADAQLQNTYVNYMLHPEARTMFKLAEGLGGAGVVGSRVAAQP